MKESKAIKKYMEGKIQIEVDVNQSIYENFISKATNGNSHGFYDLKFHKFTGTNSTHSTQVPFKKIPIVKLSSITPNTPTKKQRIEELGKKVKNLSEQLNFSLQIELYKSILEPDKTLKLVSDLVEKDSKEALKSFNEQWNSIVKNGMENILKFEVNAEEIENEFVLPEFWWLRIKDGSQIDDVFSFFEEKFKYSKGMAKYHVGMTFGYIEADYYCFNITNEHQNEITEITFEQFLTHVLKETPKEETTLRLNKWFVFTRKENERKAIVFNDGEGKSYGIGILGKWSNTFEPTAMLKFSTCREASEEEVKAALDAERIKRGLVEGVSFYGVAGHQKDELLKIKNVTYANYFFNIGFHVKDSWLYRNGEWAKPIQTLTKSEAEQKLKAKIID